jgi:ubiquinone/menaquinone biosynthesis C-methylase UbiE
MSRNETAVTTATYNQIAAQYAARNGRPEAMAEARARFAALLQPAACVLDVGCGPGHETERLRELGLRACGLDRSPGMLAQARLRDALPLLLGDMRRLPVPTARLEGLWACASFLHIPKRDAPGVLAEFRRVLAPGGVLYLAVKEGAGEGWTGEHNHKRRFFAYYQPGELDALLAAAGFAIADSWRRVVEGFREPWLSRLATATQ